MLVQLRVLSSVFVPSALFDVTTVCTSARREKPPTISVGSLNMIEHIATVLGFLCNNPSDYR